jgi:hypothetical protein
MTKHAIVSRVLIGVLYAMDYNGAKPIVVSL